MSLVATTLSAAITASDSSIKVASATSFAAGRLVLIDHEMLEVAKSYDGSSTTVPVLRGREGTKAAAHPASTYVRHGVASDFADAAPGGPAVTYASQPARDVISYTAAGAITLPSSGRDMVAIIVGTAIAMTLADPDKTIDGSILYVVNGTAAAHTVTVSSGSGGAGSSYDVFTWNGSGTAAMAFVAANGYWCALAGVPISGTVTNITIAVA